MPNVPVLYGPDGEPIRRILTSEIAGPTVSGIRSPYADYPGDGLNPRRLASLLREADQGEPLSYFELAEQIEERDPHYAGILGTRKRSVAQLDIQVDAADDTPDAKAHAAMVEEWLGRDELQFELFDMLDAVGKGVSLTEIMWDTSEGQWQPARLEWRDLRWFRFDPTDGTTPLLRVDAAHDSWLSSVAPSALPGYTRLPPGKFINAVIRAKSGLPVRSGLARLACWSWMFKAFTLRDWAIFTQTFGQPVRVGKYPAGTTQKDKDTLFRAVANIAGDCAAIIPESMTIEFIEAASVGASHALYKERADWLDQQMSKAVLGQTATTDAIAGGHAVGQEHRQVQEDIERADAKALSAIINRDLVQPWIQLQFGPQRKYPRLRIGRPEEKNVEQTIDGIVRLVPFGLQVEKSWANDLLGIPLPAPGTPEKPTELLAAPAKSSPFDSAFGAPPPAASAPQLNSMQMRRVPDAVKALADQAEQLAGTASDALIDEIRAVIDRCETLDQVRTELQQMQPGIAEFNLAGLMRMARVIANLTGRAEIGDA